jgi:hypothetical protein
MNIQVTIRTAVASREAVTVNVRFTALNGPFAGQFLDKQRVYTHPTSTSEIVADLTSIAVMLKASFGAAAELQGMVFQV